MIGPNHYHGPSARTREETLLLGRALSNTVRYAMITREARNLLAELETAIAQVEELRYRLAQELGAPAESTRLEPAPADQANPYPDLAPTGRGAWAWAKEHDRVDELAAIGRSRRFPPRIVDWEPDQVLAAAAALRDQDKAAGGAPRQPGDDEDEAANDRPPPRRTRTNANANGNGTGRRRKATTTPADDYEPPY